MRKSEEFKNKMRLQYGEQWLANPIFREQYDTLLEEEKLLAQDKLMQKIKNLKILVEESFHIDRNAEVRQKLLESIEQLSIDALEDRTAKRELFSTQRKLFEDLSIGIEKWKKALQGTDNLLAILKSAITDAREARKQYSKQFDELSAKINEYNELILLQNKKVEAFNMWAKKEQERYNREIARLNRMRA